MQNTFTGPHAMGLHTYVRARAHTLTLFNKLQHDLSKMRIIYFILSLSSSYLNLFPPLSYTAFLYLLFLSSSMPDEALVPLIVPGVICLLMTPTST